VIPYLAGGPARIWHLADVAAGRLSGFTGPVPPPLLIRVFSCASILFADSVGCQRGVGQAATVAATAPLASWARSTQATRQPRASRPANRPKWNQVEGWEAVICSRRQPQAEHVTGALCPSRTARKPEPVPLGSEGWIIWEPFGGIRGRTAPTVPSTVPSGPPGVGTAPESPWLRSGCEGCLGEPGGIRTHGQRIKSPLLYR
jgi:hypothetical protein